MRIPELKNTHALIVVAIVFVLSVSTAFILGSVLKSSQVDMLHAVNQSKAQSNSSSAFDSSMLADTTEIATVLEDPIESDSLQTEPAVENIANEHAAPVATERPIMTGKRASFSVKVRNDVFPYDMFGVFVLPGERIDIEVLFTLPDVKYNLVSEAGQHVRNESNGWFWTAPNNPGTFRLAIVGPIDTVVLQVFVMTPFSNGVDSFLEGYRIGSYETHPLKNNAVFSAPKGLVKITEENKDYQVSPSFTLGTFACHYPGNPKFAIVNERLLLKLELLLEEVRKRGVEASTFTIMSGYRTPWYNKSIGNTTTYSLHLYGLATDIFIDEDNDGQMDDLNKDGRVTRADAKFLYDVVGSLVSESWYQPFIGGLGLYGPKPHRGPFVHVDVRGYQARW